MADVGCSEKAVEDADLVVEAIIESIKVKRDLFGFLDGKARYVIPTAIHKSLTTLDPTASSLPTLRRYP
jgi:3-hydroxyacyl-CoA dehydrogenase